MFIKVSTAIFNFNLSSNAIKIYCYLILCQNCLGTATVRVSTIQSRCAVASPDTVRKALEELACVKLLRKTPRRNREGYFIASRFDLAPLRGNWIRLELARDIFLLEKSAFVLYLYFLKLQRKNCRVWPSLNMLSQALCLSKNTVIRAIKRLTAIGLLVKAALRKGKHNLYAVAQALKMKAPLFPPSKTEKEKHSKEPSLLFSLMRFLGKIKRFLLEEVVQKLAIRR